MGFLTGLFGATATGSGMIMDILNYQQQKNELDYQHELQKQQWEREDTSYQRTANDMLNAGLNPLNMQGTNGAGEVVSTNPAQFNSQNTANGQQIFSILDNLESSKMERDSLQSQIDAQKIKNAETLQDMGAYLDENGHVVFDKDSYGYKRRKTENDIQEETLSGLRTSNKKSSRELKHQQDNNMYDTDTQFERVLTALEDWIVGGRSEELKKKLIAKYPMLDTMFKWLDGTLEPEFTVERPFSKSPSVKLKK